MIPLRPFFINYRSTFERMQHLPYSSSRPWCYWQLLRSYSLPHSSMGKQLSMIIVLIYLPTKIDNSNATSPLALASQLWPPCLHNPQQKVYINIDYLNKKNKRPPKYPRFRRRTARSTCCELLPVPRIWQPPNHPRFRQRTVPSTARRLLQFSIICQPSPAIFNDQKITHQTSRAYAGSIIPSVFVRFSYKAQKSYHTSAEEGFVFTPIIMKEPTQYSPKTERFFFFCYPSE